MAVVQTLTGEDPTDTGQPGPGGRHVKLNSVWPASWNRTP